MVFRCKAVSLLLLFAIGFFCTVYESLGGTNGALAGKITDVSNGDPLVGVNVLVVGSGRGGVTNTKGEYSITAITPGTYVVRVSSIGYKKVESKKVEIEADQSTILNFKLASTDIEIEGVTAYGERPIVDTHKFSGDQTFDKNKIEALPNLKGVEDVLALQAGVVKFGNQLFLRGGRANETQILIDGVPVSNIGGGGLSTTEGANELLRQFYSGSGSSGGLSVPANAIQSVSVSSSGLDAEWGNAQSGLVNISTKSGSEKYSGTGQYRSDGIATDGFGERYYSANIGGPEPITSYLLPSLGVEVPGRLSFFMSADFNQRDGPYDFNRAQFYTPLKRKIKFGGLFGGLLSGLGFNYSDKQSNTYRFNTKLSYGIGDNDQFAFRYSATINSSHGLSWAWHNLGDSSASGLSLSTENVFQWTHIIGTNTLVKSHLSRQESQGTSSVGNLPPQQYSLYGGSDPSADGFIDFGSGQSWSTSNTVVWNAKIDYGSQVHELHYLKAGTEYFYEHLQSTNISNPLSRASARDSLIKYFSSRGEYPTYGDGRWVTNVMPGRGGLYVQDNIEFGEGLLSIHLGVRYDWFYLGKQVADSQYVHSWERVTNDRDPNTPYTYADWVDYNADHTAYTERSFFKQLTSGFFSPRLAIGYPVSQTTKFYFNYGHFLQYPDRDQIYHDPINTQFSGNYVGNPSLKPQKTIQYEAGFEQAIFDDLGLAIRGFYKDIFNYPTSGRTLGKNKYINFDYASTRGFEVILNKSLTHHYTGSIGYTFQIAKGRSSNPYAAQLSPQLQSLPRETRTDYDQEHTLNLFMAYKIGPKEDFDIFGLSFNNWGASVTWNFGSGTPYTPFSRGRTLDDAYLYNTGDGPYTSELNISFYKGFKLFEQLNLTFTLDVVNLLNRRNVDLNGGGFNSLTGRPTVFGDYDPVTLLMYSWAAAENAQSFGARVPPFIFRAPRQISLGMKINWD